MLQGEWFRSLGFDIGDEVLVIMETKAHNRLREKERWLESY
jgi:hypothetical protein